MTPPTGRRWCGDRSGPSSRKRARSGGRGERAQLGGVGEDLRGPERVPRVDDERLVGGQSQHGLEGRRRASTRSGWSRRPRRRRRAVRTRGPAWASATRGSWTATSASSRSSSRTSLCDSESRSSSVSRLKASPSTATFDSRRDVPPRRRRTPSTRNDGTLSLTRETASSMPGADDRSSENAKSLRRHVPAVKPGAAMPPRG